MKIINTSRHAIIPLNTFILFSIKNIDVNFYIIFRREIFMVNNTIYQAMFRKEQWKTVNNMHQLSQ